MGFSPQLKSRAWMLTVHTQNMIYAELTKEQYENPEYVSAFFLGVWENSGTNRTGACAVCVSEKGLYHLHMALYCDNSTTLANVSKIMFKSHVEPQLGGKKQLLAYLLKEGDYAEKGETVLYTLGMENIKDRQGSRNDLEEIEDMLNQGLTPSAIFETSFSYRRYERMIKAHYLDLRIKNIPLVKEMYCEWHCGETGTGKTNYYLELCEKHSPESIYICNDFENGGMDFYMNQGCPDILFLDEFKGGMKYSQLLNILDKYSRTQTHSRYINQYNLFSHVVIASIYPPEECYQFMVESSQRATDSMKQLLRRLNVIVYHWKEIRDGETLYKSFAIPAKEYVDYDDLKQRALGDRNGFIPVSIQDTDAVQFEIPFD